MHKSLYPWQAWLASMLLALVPVALCIDQRIKIVPVALLFVAGCWFVASDRRTRAAFGQAWQVVAVVCVLVAFIGLNALLHRLGWRPLDRAAHIVLYLAVAAVFARNLRLPLVWGGMSLGTIALGMVCLAQRYGQGIERVYGLNGGPSASIALATVLLGMVLLAFARLLDARTGRAERVIHLLAMALGMYGALLTQSRGPLLAYAPAFALLALLHAQRIGHWRKGVLLVLGACVGVAIATWTMHDDMAERFAAIGPEVTSFDHRADATGAVRERLEMWRTATRAVREHPLAGIGIGRFGHYVRGEIAAGRSNPSIGGYNQPHNQYVEAAATGGVPGLLVLLATFLVPLAFFARHVRSKDEAVAMPARAALAVIVLYLLCALTDSVFYRVMPQSFYFFTVIGMAILVGRQRIGGATAAR
ncbi:MAG: O-antigen ligase family protein [Rhodanobacter sp.]